MNLFQLHIMTTDVPTFEREKLRPELARILRDVAEQIERGSDGAPCMDASGERVGRWNLS